MADTNVRGRQHRNEFVPVQLEHLPLLIGTISPFIKDFILNLYCNELAVLFYYNPSTIRFIL